MLFSKKWLQNYPQFLLHFKIHIDVLMLCRKFELIVTKNFPITAILKMSHFLKNTLYYRPLGTKYIHRILSIFIVIP